MPNYKAVFAKIKRLKEKDKKKTPMLILEKKYGDLVRDVYALVLRNMKKFDRRIMGEYIAKILFQGLYSVNCFANRIGSRMDHLTLVDRNMKVLMSFLRTGIELKVVSVGQYEQLCLLSEEIGKIIGGLIKKEQNIKPERLKT